MRFKSTNRWSAARRSWARSLTLWGKLDRNLSGDAFHDTDHECIAHAEGALGVTHASGPAAREAVNLFEFFWDQPTIATFSSVNDVFETRRGRAALCRKN